MANKFYFDGIETSCTRIARNMCGPDEYAVTINDNGTEYEVFLLAGPFGTDEQICADGYAQWRKEHPTNPDNIPSTMNANEIVASLNESQIRRACAALLPTKFFDEYFTPERGNIALLRQMLEDHVFEYDTPAAEIIEAAGAGETANEATEMGKTFNVYLWCGRGYCLDCFPACASCEEEALYKVVAEVISAGYTDYYMSEEEMEQAVSDGVVYAFPDFNEVEGWMYIDATMEGAPYPVWLCTENLKIEAA